MDKIKISVMGEAPIEINKGTTLLEVSKSYTDKLKWPILVARNNNKIEDLTKPILTDANIEFLDISSSYGFRTYQHSVVFLMLTAAKTILGKTTRILVEHSISKNIYCEIAEEEKIEVTEALLEKIEAQMRQMFEQNIPIERISVPIEEAMNLATSFNLKDKLQILNFRRTSSVNLYKLDWFYNYFYGEMVPSTGYLGVFSLRKQGSGFMLQFADQVNPENLREIRHLEKISNIFIESSKWGKILNVDTVGALNEKMCNEGLGNIIRINESLHEKKLAEVADQVTEGGKHIVFIAGPTSSGKTTFAHRLAIHLRVNGLNPHVISLDNYYKDRDKIPVDEFGELDLESINALDVEMINRDLGALLRHEEVTIPKYDFTVGKKTYKNAKPMILPQNGVLIIEGIHGLNDQIGENIPASERFRIFISALTQLNIDDHNRIPTSDTRLIRRIVRDAAFRGTPAAGNIAMWPSVQRGENKYIFPYQDKADAIFNSALVYEISILKQYAEPLLFAIDRSMPEYTEARRLIKLLDSFLGASSEEVPRHSLLREFIGGSSINVH